jgi:hypothetical protein
MLLSELVKWESTTIIICVSLVMVRPLLWAIMKILAKIALLMRFAKVKVIAIADGQLLGAM